jgi:hypothetical protein
MIEAIAFWAAVAGFFLTVETFHRWRDALIAEELHRRR